MEKYIPKVGERVAFELKRWSRGRGDYVAIYEAEAGEIVEGWSGDPPLHIVDPTYDGDREQVFRDGRGGTAHPLTWLFERLRQEQAERAAVARADDVRRMTYEAALAAVAQGASAGVSEKLDRVLALLGEQAPKQQCFHCGRPVGEPHPRFCANNRNGTGSMASVVTIADCEPPR